MLRFYPLVRQAMRRSGRFSQPEQVAVRPLRIAIQPIAAFDGEISEVVLRLTRLFALALTSALGLSACAGSGLTMPSAALERRLASSGAQPNATCPKRYSTCVAASKSAKIELFFCYGPTNDPCSKSDAGKVKWSGVVCHARGPTCNGPIRQLTAKWSGPFKCINKGQKCNGTFELDTIEPGPGLKETNKIRYKQVVHMCKDDGCQNKTIGFRVGP